MKGRVNLKLLLLLSLFHLVVHAAEKKKKAPCLSKCALTKKLTDVDDQLLQLAMDIENVSVKETSSNNTAVNADPDENTQSVSQQQTVETSQWESRLRRLEKNTDNVEAMLADLKLLKIQNTLLRSKTKSSDNVARVVREQNSILLQQNVGLREGYNIVQRKVEEFENRIILLEDASTAFNNSILSLRNLKSMVNEGISNNDDNSDLMGELGQTNTNLRDITIRMERVEEWIQQLLETGSAPPLMYQPTLHPQPDIPPRDCEEIRRMGFTTSGVYSIQPWGAREAFDVYCEQDYYDGGWTVIQKRRDGSENFDRSWDDYTNGFGNLHGEHWIGNEKIHQITDQNLYRLHIVLLDWEGERRYAEYSSFNVGSSREFYNLRFGTYNGNAGDGFRGNADDGSRNLYLARFGSRDVDNDSCLPCVYEGDAFNNCAVLMRGGWWYRACADSNLNGQYIQYDDLSACEGECFGVRWAPWHDEINYSLKASMMMVKTFPTEQ